jgi:hypothetical protein
MPLENVVLAAFQAKKCIKLLRLFLWSLEHSGDSFIIYFVHLIAEFSESVPRHDLPFPHRVTDRSKSRPEYLSKLRTALRASCVWNESSCSWGVSARKSPPLRAHGRPARRCRDQRPVRKILSRPAFVVIARRGLLSQAAAEWLHRASPKKAESTGRRRVL